jgi:glycosyltransferase involved in cell wall biosynthesis
MANMKFGGRALGAAEARRHFRIGQALKLVGLNALARSHLERAFEIDPRFEIWRAVGDPTFDPGKARPTGRRHLELDISDLLNFLVAHGVVTGIQRVQLELLRALLDASGAPWGFDQVMFCFSAKGYPWVLETADLVALVAYAEGGVIDVARARRLVRRARATARPGLPPRGSVYLVLGAFWAGKDQSHRRRIRETGAAFGVLVHDLFPIILPDLCEPGARVDFEVQLKAGLKAWDFVVTNSDFTAGSLRLYMAGIEEKCALPIIAAPLAHSHAWPRAAAAPPKVLRGRRFVLCVGTIEPRKNLGALIEAWKGLDRSGAASAELVLVGRPGWRMEAVVKSLRRGALRRYGITWLGEVSDTRLEALYQNCLFTVFPSLAEGWGLPIGESLVHGKVCLTSDTTAMPEVGGDFAVYADPHDFVALRRALESLLADTGERAAREARIQRDFRPRTWGDYARDLMTGLAALQSGVTELSNP